MAAIVFENVSKVYGDGIRAVNGLDLAVADGEFMVLVGPSGCGKTTALRMVAGLEVVSDGTLRIGPRVVNDLAPRERDIAMVFQNYALYPHMSVADNIGFGLKMRRIRGRERQQRIEKAATTLGLADLLDRKPGQLSGGQRQRVAMGRAIVRQPVAYLMDEPLSNLDAKLRVQMRAEIARIQRDLETTTVYVTHDQVEAMTMGDRVAVMRRGELQQVDAPQRLYDAPANMFVATFIGSPAMNLLEGTVREGGRVSIGTRDVPGVVAHGHAGRTVAVGIRPEAFAVAGDGQLEGVVRFVEALGPEKLVYVDVDATPVVSDEVLEGSVVEAEEEAIAADLRSGRAEGTASVVARVDPTTGVEPGERITLALTGKVHLFDIESGNAIR